MSVRYLYCNNIDTLYPLGDYHTSVSIKADRIVNWPITYRQGNWQIKSIKRVSIWLFNSSSLLGCLVAIFAPLAYSSARRRSLIQSHCTKGEEDWVDWMKRRPGAYAKPTYLSRRNERKGGMDDRHQQIFMIKPELDHTQFAVACDWMTRWRLCSLFTIISLFEWFCARLSSKTK